MPIPSVTTHNTTQTWILMTQTWILIGVVAHLCLAVAKWIWKTPKQQAQIDALGAKVDTVLALLPGATRP